MEAVNVGVRTAARWPRSFRDAGRRRGSSRRASERLPTQEGRVLGPVVLSQVDVQVRGAPGLLRIVAEGPSSSCCGHVPEHLLDGMVDRVPGHHGAISDGRGRVGRVRVNGVSRPLEKCGHGVHMGDRMTQPDITVSCVYTFLADALGINRPMVAYPALDTIAERCEAMPEFSSVRAEFLAPGPVD